MTSSARFAVFLTIVLAIWSLQHLYVGWRLLSLPLVRGAAVQRGLVVALALGLLSYPAARYVEHLGWLRLSLVLETVGSVWMGFLFLLVISLLVADAVTLGGLALKPWLASVRSAAVAVALVAGVVAVIGARVPPRTLAVEAVVEGLPAEHDGLVLVAVSDVHLGSSVGERRLRTIVDRAVALEPDLLVVVGDMVDGSAHLLEPMLPELERLRAPLGAFAVLGNHELYIGAERSRRFLGEAGFEVLDNRGVEVAPGLVVAGVPDPRSSAQTGSIPADLGAALAGVDPAAAVILLQHSPEDEAAAAAAGVDLMLCGHTHGGQIWPFNLFVRLSYPHLAGVFRVGAMTLVVSRGAGFWGPPMRLFAPADIVRVTLRSPAAHLPGGQ